MLYSPSDEAKGRAHRHDDWVSHFLKTLALVPALLVVGASVASTGARSSAARAEFKRLNPCPSTGLHRGACPGFVIDHVQPLCAGGADAPHNMQWQSVEAGKAKDRTERVQCSRRH